MLVEIIEKLKVQYLKLSSDRNFGEIFNGSIIVFIAKIIATIIGLVTSVIVARFYGAEIVGIVALINTYFSLVMVFSLLGTDTSILRFIPEYKKKYSTFSAYIAYKKIRFFVILLAFCLSGLLFFLSGFIADNIFGRPDITFLFMIASGIIVFKTLQVFSLQGIRAIQKIKTFAFLNILTPIGYLILLVFATYFFYNKYNPVYIQFLLAIIVSTISLILIQQTFKKSIRTSDPIEKLSYRTIFRVSFPMFLTSSLMILNGQMANLLLGYFRTEEEIGYYAIAFKIATLTVFILQAINTTIAPKFSELYFEGRIKELFIIARKSTKLIFWGTIPLLAVFVLFGKWIIISLYGAEFEISYYALLIITVGMLVGAFTGSVGYFLNMCGQEHVMKNVSIITIIISFLIGIILIPNYGVYAAALATAVSQSIRNIVLTIIIYKKFRRTFLYIPFIIK